MLRFFLRGQGHQGIFFPVGKHPQTKSTFQGDARPAIASFVLLRANLVQSSSFNYLQSASHTKSREYLKDLGLPPWRFKWLEQKWEKTVIELWVPSY